MAEHDTPTLILVQSTVSGTLKLESRDGDAIGSVYAFMVHKRSGRATHAVLALGGFLGMGKSFYPVPFSLLQFDPVGDQYVITVDRRLLEGGPSWSTMRRCSIRLMPIASRAIMGWGRRIWIWGEVFRGSLWGVPPHPSRLRKGRARGSGRKSSDVGL